MFNQLQISWQTANANTQVDAKGKIEFDAFLSDLVWPYVSKLQHVQTFQQHQPLKKINGFDDLIILTKNSFVKTFNNAIGYLYDKDFIAK